MPLFCGKLRGGTQLDEGAYEECVEVKKKLENARNRELLTITGRLTNCCGDVTGACTLLDKVLNGMVAKPRS
jgi:hypothetical protein